MSFVALSERKSRLGYRATVVRKVNKLNQTVLPPRRTDVEEEISSRYWNLAFYYAYGEIGPGIFDFQEESLGGLSESLSQREEQGRGKVSGKLAFEEASYSSCYSVVVRQDEE